MAIAVCWMSRAALADEKPNVLIIGDSISMNYTPVVQKILVDTANVERVPGNCRSSAHGAERVEQWVAGEKWDVIHFNFGLWDWYGWQQDTRATPESYRRNLEQIVGHLKATGARLVFATTTPPCPAAEHSSRVLVTPGRATEFRAVALKLMKANGIRINDLHQTMLPVLATHQKAANDVHFKRSGRDMLATKVAAAIRDALASQSVQPGTADYREHIAPLLKTHCYRCHSDKLQEGDIRLDNVKRDFARERELWDKVENQIAANAMPPEKPLLSGDQRLAITDWIQAQKEKVDWSAYRRAGHVTLPLLNRTEYENTVRALFNDRHFQNGGTYFDFARSLSDDGVGDTGFSSDRDSPSLAMTAARMEKYVRITENVLDYYFNTDKSIIYTTEAEEMKATTAILTPTENGIMIKANRDSLYARWEYPRSGWYIIDVKAWGERVDNRACAEMVIYLDRDEVGQVRLLSTRAQPGQYRCLVWIEKGHHTLRFRPQRSGMTLAEAALPVPPPFPDTPVIADFNDLSLGTGVYMCMDQMQIRGPVNQLPNDFSRNEDYTRGLIAPPTRSIITQQNTPDAERKFDLAWEKKHGLTINRDVSREKLSAEFTNVWVRPLVATDFSAPPSVATLIAADGEGRSAARQVIRRFGRRAFRRPLSAEDIDFFLTFYDDEVGDEVGEGAVHRAGLKAAFVAIMLSPDFFYRIPQRRAPHEERKLDSYEMASRLSYFLWNSMPDEELFALAEADKLTDPTVIERQVERMLNCDQGRRMVGIFAREWLGYRELGVTIKPDEGLFATAYYTGQIESLFKQETEAFVNHIFAEDRPLEELITAEYAFWNKELAQYYSDSSDASEILAASIHGSPEVTIAVPNGTYTLQLLLYEGWEARSAEIVIEGKTVREEYDQLQEQGGTFRYGSVLRYTLAVTDGTIDNKFKANNVPNTHIGGLILSRGRAGAGVSTRIVKTEADLDLKDVLKAINFGDTKDVLIGDVQFVAAPANSTVDSVTNKAAGDVFAGEFAQKRPQVTVAALPDTSDELMKVQLPANSTRGGLLGMGSVLTVTSHPTRTSAVDRGLWVYEKLFGKRLPDPPIVPALKTGTGEPGATNTFREVLETHRANRRCASCHNKIDPIGFGLENFDPIGRWRRLDGGKPIDASGTLPGGRAFNGPRELKQELVENRDDFYRNMARTVLTYALGRKLEFYDRPVIDRIVDKLKETNGSSHELFKMVAKSYPFTHASDDHRRDESQ